MKISGTYKEKYKELSKIFDVFINSSFDGFWSWDLINEGGYMSPRLKEILGYKDYEMPNVQKSWQDIIFPEDLEIATENYKKHLANPNYPYEQLVRYHHKKGHTVWVYCKGVILRKNNIPYKFVGIHTDVTKLKITQLELEEKIKLNEKLYAAKNVFVSSISHELRTPIAGMLGLTNILLQEELTKKQKVYLQKIKSCGDNLNSLINDVLDYGRLEACKISINESNMHIKRELNHIIESCKNHKSYKGIDIYFHISKNCPKYILIDKDRYYQVVSNLLTNSIKYTKKGGIKIHVIVNKGKIITKVKDTGIGISKNKQKFLFKEFYQVNSGNGVGLGLAISKKIAVALGGDITVKSKKDKGSTFTFIANAKRSKKKSVKNDSVISYNNISILVAEDNKVNQIVISEMLKKIGVKSYVVSNGMKAINRLRKKGKYNAIFMDLHMPKVDGYTATKIIKQHLSLPIIALTANALPGDRKKCLHRGFDGYISKPFNENDLIKVLNTLPSAKKQIMKINVVLELTPMAEKMLPEIKKSIKSNMRHLKRAADEDNKKKMKFYAHKLKNTILFLKTEHILPILEKIEEGYMELYVYLSILLEELD